MTVELSAGVDLMSDCIAADDDGVPSAALLKGTGTDRYADGVCAAVEL